MAFTAAQSATMATGDPYLRILARAGSGKSEFVSRRIAGLLARPGAEPRREHVGSRRTAESGRR
ncbi:hypothetical protein KGA66_28185 [Actinocrinis puniceicyclus]|uniref:Uncharacterized protein n=1 Tax=Actinocrinis puniceicyclus TaxID=977794 RepID=A0A8J7WQV4_9ACTN|nr:hypothetical protein [Actinocrinis puniceicyclus]MBS2966946.1 hypothetical protein [Actinocrinis puniceicyclus]